LYDLLSIPVSFLLRSGNFGGSAKMGKDVPSIPDNLRPILSQVAEQIGREIYPNGLPRGTRFSDLETLSGWIGDELGRSIIESQARAQADDLAGDSTPVVCPTCGQTARAGPTEHRDLTTTQGTVAWDEPAAYCPSCRRSFFPSVPSLGARSLWP
jgi:hypothetical protein